MTPERLHIAQITWQERVETDSPGTTYTRERSRTENVWATDYWKVYRELLDRGVFPEQKHNVRVWRVVGDDEV